MSHSAARPLQRMFNAVPARYDLCNRVLTLGLDERWRKLAARACLDAGAKRVLDLCCGTGDLILRIARQAEPDAQLYGLDFSPGMLEIARAKALRSAATRRIEFTEGDAAAMPFASASFDSVGIAFGFRNLTWRNPVTDEALAEVLRVLRPGGQFVIVETSQPPNPVWRCGCHAYHTLLAAPLGGLMSGNAPAYKYLARSARDFYSAPEACALLDAVGFCDTQARLLLGGVAALIIARKL
jgi:demethylmenaquinone methyltransferase / 2-methoxy-6-polyprenyl-1,4-benzoquinol methylase